MRVIQKYQVKLVGWIYNKFVSPFEIHTIDNVRTLVEALRCGRCHWVRMTATEVTKNARDVEARKAAGETVGKQRKVRSDLGKRPRKGNADDDDGNNEAGPSKKRKPAVRKSAATKKPSTASKTGKGKKKASSSKSSKSQASPWQPARSSSALMMTPVINHV